MEFIAFGNEDIVTASGGEIDLASKKVTVTGEQSAAENQNYSDLTWNFGKQ